ncbi:MAG: urate hydroxylase PuuD [Bdellovibrionota bacterium]
MELAIFSYPGLHLVLKWLHIFFGIMWIGHLYYFNFTQGSFMTQTDGPTKSQVQQRLLPIALYWFRWGAMWTFVSGLLMLHTASKIGFSLGGDWGVKILTGGLFGILMWANVWFIIWPKQKVVIQNATDVAGGKPANPAVPGIAAAAGLASRTNTLLSIPMLFFMVAAPHLAIEMNMDNVGAYWAFLAVLLIALEFNAIKGKQGPMTTVKGVITSGFVLTAIVYLAMELIL